MSAAVPALPFPVALDEDAVRRLCGAATFARADAFQRAGHVVGAKTGGDGLTANVRGTWRRIDQATILAKSGRLFPNCSRDGTEFCRHAGALLLHWLRQPTSFAPTGPLSGDEQTSGPAPRPVTSHVAERESETEELSRLLDYDTVAHLREIARNRDVRVAAGKKAGVVRQLATDLTDPAGIDVALATLSSNERTALDAIHLGGAEIGAQPQAIAAAYSALGGEGEPPFVAAVEAGLALSSDMPYYDWHGYVVPRAVAARLPALDQLARQAKDASSRSNSRSSALGIVELLQVVALELQAGGIEENQMVPGGFDNSLPDGLMIDPAADQQTTVYYTLADQQKGYPVIPRRLLAENALDRLATRTGQPGAAVDFVVRVMLALDMIRDGPEISLRRDQLQALLEMPAPARLAQLAQAWLATAGPAELGILASRGSRVRLHWRATYAGWIQPMQPLVASAAHLVVRLAGRMTPNQWYEVDSLVQLVERLAPTAAPQLAQCRQSLTGHYGLAFSRTTKKGKQERLETRTAEGWSHLLSALVAAILTGPMQWLGLVDVAGLADGSAAFRVLPAAGVLVDRGLDNNPPELPGRVTIDDDLSILVPAGTTDVSVHGLLALIGELFEASADGLRYRLTAAGVHAAFDAGTTGPELAGLLAERAGGTLPAAVAAAIDRWWQGYGAIRLYDELTVIELRDDLLLTELLAATPLAAIAIHTFSPRLIAINPNQAEQLIAALTNRGYAPRVVEEG